MQFGVGYTEGEKNSVHDVRLLKALHLNATIVSLDLSNAFNSVNKSTFLNEIQEHFPALAARVWQCYGNPSTLLLKSGSAIESSAGSLSSINTHVHAFFTIEL